MEWNMEENFGMEWKIFSIEWKKIASMEYRKNVFHSIPYPVYRIMSQKCVTKNVQR